MSLSYYAPAHTYGQPKVKQIPSVSPSPNKERKTEKENKEREKREKEKKKERKRKKEKRKSEKNCRVMDGWTDGQRDGRIDRRMDGLTNIDIGCMALGEKKVTCFRGHFPWLAFQRASIGGQKRQNLLRNT